MNTKVDNYFPEAHQENEINFAQFGGQMQQPFKKPAKIKKKQGGSEVKITYDPRERLLYPTIMPSDNTRVNVPVKIIEDEQRLLQNALKNSQERVESGTPFNDYTQAHDLNILQGIKAWGLGNIFNRGTSNCTLNATNCFGPSFTMAHAKNIVLDRKGNLFRQIIGNDIPIGALTIQSLPNIPDTSENAKYHTMIFAGLADSDYVNQFGDTISVGDTLFNYSNGGHRKGDFRQRPMHVLKNNNGMTYFRFFVPK